MAAVLAIHMEPFHSERKVRKAMVELEAVHDEVGCLGTKTRTTGLSEHVLDRLGCRGRHVCVRVGGRVVADTDIVDMIRVRIPSKNVNVD